jgi:hypothetical protein
MTYCIICERKEYKYSINISINPTKYSCYPKKFTLSNMEPLPNVKKKNEEIIGQKGMHTFKNIFIEGFFFRNMYPKISFLTASI